MLPVSTFHEVFASSPAAEALFSSDPSPIILAVNDAFLKVSARTAAELIGKALFEAFPADSDDDGESGVAALGLSLQRVFTTGQPDRLPLQRYPIRVQQADGSEHYQVRYWSVLNRPIFDTDGQLVCISHCTHDVTETKFLQDELDATLVRQEFLLALSNRMRPLESPEAIARTASEMLCRNIGIARVQYAEVNADQATFQVRCEWSEGALPPVKGLWRLMDDFGPEIIAALRRGEPVMVDNIRKDPRTAPFAGAYESIGVRASLAIPVVNAGRLVTVLCLHDSKARHWTANESALACEVAERTWSAAERARTQAELDAQREASEHALTESNRRKDEFLAMLAHELRNPLAPISAAAELMGMVQLDEARAKRTSGVIRRQVTHMAGLLDDLLDVSRVTRGLITLDEAPQDLKLVVANAVEQVLPLIESQSHRLRIDLPAEAVTVLGDQKRLVQVLTNLLNNAAKYTPPGGEISLRVETDGATVCMHVKDTGIGICPSMHERVFELFEQGQRSADRAQGGLGLGLALVKSLAELHRGTVKCSSDGLGKGTCFTVCLPQLRDRSGGATAGFETAAVEPVRVARRILVVDDNADAAEMLRLLLEAAGHDVMVENDATSGLASARLNAPDVGLLDIGLPDMDGAELARRLREHPATARMKLIAVTGYGQEPDRKNATDAGFDHHMVKPVDLAALMALIEAT